MFVDSLSYGFRGRTCMKNSGEPLNRRGRAFGGRPKIIRFRTRPPPAQLSHGSPSTNCNVRPRFMHFPTLWLHPPPPAPLFASAFSNSPAPSGPVLHYTTSAVVGTLQTSQSWETLCVQHCRCLRSRHVKAQKQQLRVTGQLSHSRSVKVYFPGH